MTAKSRKRALFFSRSTTGFRRARSSRNCAKPARSSRQPSKCQAQREADLPRRIRGRKRQRLAELRDRPRHEALHVVRPVLQRAAAGKRIIRVRRKVIVHRRKVRAVQQILRLRDHLEAGPPLAAYQSLGYSQIATDEGRSDAIVASFVP